MRGTATDGDAARYERYRDLGDGLFLERRAPEPGTERLVARISTPITSAAAISATAATSSGPGRLKSWFLWDQIPMLLSRTTRTLFTGVGTGVLAIDDALQAQVQAQPAAIDRALQPVRPAVRHPDAPA